MIQKGRKKCFLKVSGMSEHVRTENLFFEVIQVALRKREKLSSSPSDNEWAELFVISNMQSVVGVTFTALEKLNEQEQKLPMNLLYEWIGNSEQIRQQNSKMNKEAVCLTKLFESEGHQTAILKGQANALLYPTPMSRQPGDIDIWVSGGKEKILQTLQRLNLFNGKLEKYDTNEDATETYHHIHLPKNENGIDVEVHFRPSSGNMNPFTNKRLQAFLEEEIQKNCTLVDEGFRVPDIRFALVMQLAHIQRHLVSEGVGMRQVIDYYYLLKSDVNNQRDEVFHSLKPFGLKHIAEALMWVLHEKLGLEEEYLIAPMDEKRGKMLLHQIMEGGNFGHYHPDKQHGLGRRILAKNRHRLQMFRFDFSEAFWTELDYLTFIIKTIPARIKRRKWSLE